MWRPPITFITLHYAWIISAGLLGLIAIYPYGNVSAIDAYFFGASASTESGLNTFDVKDLKTYQQVVIYFIPIFTNLGFVNIIVVATRLRWLNKRLVILAPSLLKRGSHTAASPSDVEADVEAQVTSFEKSSSARDQLPPPAREGRDTVQSETGPVNSPTPDDEPEEQVDSKKGGRITFAEDVNQPPNPSKALYIPPPRERDQGYPIAERETFESDDDEDAIKPVDPQGASSLTHRRAYKLDGPSLSTSKSIEKIASSMFILGASKSKEKPRSSESLSRRPTDLPYLSREVTVGRNSQFHNLSAEDRERLGGIEYRSLKLLLKIVSGYFFGLHCFGVLCLLPWIHSAPSKYTEWLQECGQSKTWWAFYSAETMISNCGFTLTPDSMVTFRDATWPMLSMSFLAYAGNTLYPVFLRLVIWTMSKLVPTHSSMSEPLQFLLDHPRRCYTLLFPSRPTWILFGIIFVLNFIDVVLIVVLDLNNPAVSDLAVGPRILAAIFQSASARHTGTASFNLAEVNPAVQFSLVVMMYVAILPIAISIRASNTYEEKSLGIYGREESLDESKGTSYVMTHIRNQLSFDLWYIFLGTFCICISESSRIVDNNDPAFAIFSIFFEVVSAYGNVGLSLGYPTVSTSLSGQFKTFSKVVICAMMIRGRHRGLPYALDRAIKLPGERLGEDAGSDETDVSSTRGPRNNSIKRSHTY